MNLLVAIPCLNEEKNIGDVIKKIPKKIGDISDIEVLVVDDGSSDRTSEIARGVGATVIRHKSNKGLGCAFQTAINYAVNGNKDIMVNMDGDGQFDPDDIEQLIRPIIDEKADITTASRFIDKCFIPDMPKIKYWGNKGMSYMVSKLCGERFYDVSCGFRAYCREALLRANFHGKYTYTQESFIFFTSQNLIIKEIPIRVKYFQDRKSRVAGSLWKYGRKTMGIIFSLYRDYYPMRLFGMITAFFATIAIIFGVIFFAHYIMTGVFTGYLFAGLISAFSLLCSLAFLCCGISMQSSVRMQENQNRILYLLKRGINE